ncbi:hypothetical protein SAMN04487943_10589 [Gracilibacillus orientalis]|uniref:Uncharacterized protein n=1 Tax=Gracilibacillus orientalis TaxID=334253 RepID=A0A1I4LLN9_9BACI|nr:hypothetical protein [Gracilibacillus orientalis]SFL91895.1 hypothetical protein SAMN04487943_10589 [Gracilibacillus orientalis]
MDNVEVYKSLPGWLQRIVPFISIVLSLLAFSYVFFRYTQGDLEFVHWLRIIIFSIIGVVLLFSAITFAFNKEESWKLLIGGLTLLPILLMLQLFLLILKVIRIVIQSIFQGSVPEPIRMFIENYPSKFDIIILSVLFIIGVMWIIDQLKKPQK